MKQLKTTPNWLPIKKHNFTDNQLIELYHIVFIDNTHSNGFMISEMKDLLYDESYWFMEMRNDKWEENLKNKLKEFGYKL